MPTASTSSCSTRTQGLTPEQSRAAQRPPDPAAGQPGRRRQGAQGMRAGSARGTQVKSRIPPTRIGSDSNQKLESDPMIMSDTPQQPGLNSLSKSFEPAAIEAQWGPLWEERGYARAGYRGTGEPKEGEPVVLHPAAAAERDGHAAHGARVQPDHHGQPDALPPHARLQHAVGAGHRPCRHRHADRGGAPAAGAGPVAPRPGPQELRREGLGVEGKVRQHHHHARCAAWATAWTGRTSTSRWTRTCRKVVTADLRAAVRAGPDLPRQAPGELGPGAEDRRERPGSGERRGGRLPLAHPLSAGRRQRRR